MKLVGLHYICHLFICCLIRLTSSKEFDDDTTHIATLCQIQAPDCEAIMHRRRQEVHTGFTVQLEEVSSVGKLRSLTLELQGATAMTFIRNLLFFPQVRENDAGMFTYMWLNLGNENINCG